MTILHEARLADSPYVDMIMRGRTVSDGSTIRPAENHWHMAFVRQSGQVRPLIVGPWTTAGVASWGEGAEILWIKFKLGTFMPHLPATDVRDTETLLPAAGHQSFWLKDAAWQCPDYENADTFVNRLVRAEVLVRDPVVEAALEDQPLDSAPRTVRHRFLRSTGLSQNHIRQMKRAQQAEALLQQGVSIPDVVYQLGYFDQPHLSRSLRQFIGHTPARLIRMSAPA